MNEFVAILDFGGQYKQLIARRVRECNVYCEILPYTTSLEALTARNPKGIILTGGPNSVYDPESPTYDRKLFELGIPVLGICYGSQLMAYKLGGDVKTAPTSEYGHTNVIIDAKDSLIFSDVSGETGARRVSFREFPWRRRGSLQYERKCGTLPEQPQYNPCGTSTSVSHRIHR